MMSMSASNILLIYADKLTPRLEYIVSTLFQEQARTTIDLEYFKKYEGPRLNYSSTNISSIPCHIYPYGLLEQSNICKQDILFSKWKDHPAFFNTEGTIPFDLFSAAFYLITRYEEWLPHQKDSYGRYLPEQSLAYQNGFLQFPLVNYWLDELAKELNVQVSRQFFFKPSYDIDIAYSYLHQSSFRNALGYFKQLVNLKFNQVVERLQVLAGTQNDPYYVYDWLHLLHESLQLKPMYFFLLASRRDALHKNISPNSGAMQLLIRDHAKKYTVGIHPSVIQHNSIPITGTREQVLEKEIKLLAEIIQEPVKNSRQHYIHLNFPETYRALVNSGVEADYSMGYPQINGFRASFTKPFIWFDLVANQPSPLVIYPFCYMDATVIFNEKRTVAEATKTLEDMYKLYQKYGGVFIPIFHNNFLTTQPVFIGWRNMYADFLLKYCTK
ncbi:MAG: hypothetical protein B7Y11_11740 [Sphingobacteriia bacterium 24-36-13]|jgi:hypothetical protein|nr:MAG: hypothetical protein B7Y66_09620 [Sphingobacteriia bacterium 35-36-14]OYZ52559.1 MAG: hypothetical protein B7Y11_11740 [Sphingobacteriia bacterium 24-36-13]